MFLLTSPLHFYEENIGRDLGCIWIGFITQNSFIYLFLFWTSPHLSQTIYFSQRSSKRSRLFSNLTPIQITLSYLLQRLHLTCIWRPSTGAKSHTLYSSSFIKELNGILTEHEFYCWWMNKDYLFPFVFFVCAYACVGALRVVWGCQRPCK